MTSYSPSLSTICIRRTPQPEAAKGANLINGPIEVFQLFYEKMRIGRISSKLLKRPRKFVKRVTLNLEG